MHNTPSFLISVCCILNLKCLNILDYKPKIVLLEMAVGLGKESEFLKSKAKR